MIHAHTYRIAVISLLGLVQGRPMSPQAKDRTSQLCAAITDSTQLLLQWGHHRAASAVLQLTGRAWRELGERHCGLEHQQYILQVSAVCV